MKKATIILFSGLLVFAGNSCSFHGAESGKRLSVCSVQMSNASSIRGNSNEIISAINEASRNNCDVVVFPEYAVTGCGPHLRVLPDYSQIQCEMEKIKEAARKKAITVIVGSLIKTEDNQWYDAAVVINKDGAEHVIGKERFTQPEKKLFKPYPGNGDRIFKINGITCAAMICCEGPEYPELWQKFEGKNIAVLFWLTFYSPEKALEQAPEFAKRLNCWLVQSNWANASDNIPYGASVIFSPDGQLKERGEKGKTQLIFTEIFLN